MPKVSVNVDSGDERCRRYSDLRPDELEHMVKHLENDAKRAKSDPHLRRQVLGAVQEAKEEIAKRIKR
jgi:hypothetical protein|tara:strand:- start:11459 stop:11662 length:204 start_codon:yes stop_codon:yes gene_type:complete